MKQSEMTCSKCVYSKQTANGLLRCIQSIPSRWESITSFDDFPEVGPLLACGQGAWWGTIQDEGETIPWLFDYYSYDEPETDTGASQ